MNRGVVIQRSAAVRPSSATSRPRRPRSPMNSTAVTPRTRFHPLTMTPRIRCPFYSDASGRLCNSRAGEFGPVVCASTNDSIRQRKSEDHRSIRAACQAACLPLRTLLVSLCFERIVRCTGFRRNRLRRRRRRRRMRRHHHARWNLSLRSCLFDRGVHRSPGH